MKKFKANGKEGIDLLCSLKNGVPLKFYRFLGISDFIIYIIIKKLD